MERTPQSREKEDLLRYVRALRGDLRQRWPRPREQRDARWQRAHSTCNSKTRNSRTKNNVQHNNNSANSRAFVNFNGGNLRITESGSAIRTAVNNSATVLTVGNGGASLEVGSNVTASLDLPLDPPAGQGLVAIGINTRGVAYIAPPFVNITGGGGFGAKKSATHTLTSYVSVTV